MDYQRLFSNSLPAPVSTHPGLTADTKYVFSVTYADPQTVPYEGLSDAIKEAMQREGPDLANCEANLVRLARETRSCFT